MLDDWSLFRRECVGRSFALLLSWRGDGGLELVRESNGRSYRLRRGRSIRGKDAYLPACAGEGSNFGGTLDWPILTNKNPVRSTRLEAVHRITVLDVLGLFFVQLHVPALVETHI